MANISALSYAKAIDKAFHKNLIKSETYEDFFSAVQKRTNEQCDGIYAGLDKKYQDQVVARQVYSE